MSFRDDRQALVERLAEFEQAAAENVRLKQRVGELENDNRRLSAVIEQLRAQIRRASLPAAATAAPAGTGSQTGSSAPMRPRMPSVPTGKSVLALSILGPTTSSTRDESFDNDIIKIGRVPSCHLLFEHADVSRIHAVIERQEQGGFIIIDLGSSTGTFVNDNRVNKTSLAVGDVIKIGPFLITVAF